MKTASAGRALLPGIRKNSDLCGSVTNRRDGRRENACADVCCRLTYASEWRSL